MRAINYGIKIGTLKSGPLSKISDVPGVTVGHSTIHDGTIHTGVTVISPSEENIFLNKFMAASHVINGYGKSIGLMQLDELGQLESPILLTNTLNVGKVSDGLVDFMVESLKEEGRDLLSFNPIVCECNDSSINDIRKRPVEKKHVRDAFDNLCRNFEEGSIGGGTGMICHQLKGGIGSASRVMTFDDKDYTLGVLVQSNHGLLSDLTVNNVNIGQVYKDKTDVKADDHGSIIIIIATDLPLTSRQLKRVCKRATNGISRVGCYSGHGSGEVVIGFSTSNIIKDSSFSKGASVQPIQMLSEHRINSAFRACVEATEEAVLNSMFASNETKTLKGKTIPSIQDVLAEIGPIDFK